MKVQSFLLVGALLQVSASAQGIPACMLGRWKSDEGLTLEDMRRHSEVTAKARALFEDGLFGKLVVVFGPGYYGAFHDGESGTTTYPFQPYDIVSRGPESVVLREQLLGITQLQRWTCENGRIYTLVSRWEFREYFSPAP